MVREALGGAVTLERDRVDEEPRDVDPWELGDEPVCEGFAGVCVDRDLEVVVVVVVV